MKFESEAQRRHYEEDYKPAYDALMTCYPFTLADLDDEQWRPINDDYHVSNYGRIKSFKQRRTGKILKPALDKGGYLFVGLHRDGERKNFFVHVLVAKAFITNVDNKPEVNHRIGWKLNCYVGNLEWATSSENQQHAFDTGLQVGMKGTKNPLAKIQDEEIIIYIRNNPDGLTVSQLAEKFGMKPSHISEIQTGKSYTDAGGSIRKSKCPRVSDEIRAAIRADYATGNFTQRQLAKKYNLARSTVWRIINED